MESASRHGGEIERASATYLATVTECVRALDDALSGGDDRVSDLESACDDAGRDVLAALGTASPTFRPAYLHAGDLAEFYARVDEIANHAEAVAMDYRAMQPPLADVRGRLRAMVADAAVACEYLETATGAYLAAADRETVLDAIGRIRDLEGACDDRRHDAVRRAFATRDPAPALLVREIVHGVDAVVDSVEDAADHLQFVVSMTP